MECPNKTLYISNMSIEHSSSPGCTCGATKSCETRVSSIALVFQLGGSGESIALGVQFAREQVV